MARDPINEFGRLLGRARKIEGHQAGTCALATAAVAGGAPLLRFVDLMHVDQEGFSFCMSHLDGEIENGTDGSLCFFWPSLYIQVRVEGPVEVRPTADGGPAGGQAYRVVPRRIEIWHGRAFRLHDRAQLTQTEKGWVSQRLYP